MAASSVGLPRYTGSYKSKPWAYFAYTTQEKRDAAMEITCSLKGRHLQWIFPSEVKDLCVQCVSKDHKTKECDAFKERGRKTIPKNVQNNYARFKPVGYVKPLPLSRSRGSITLRSRSHSHSCSNSKNNTHNINKFKGNITGHHDNRTDDTNTSPDEL